MVMPRVLRLPCGLPRRSATADLTLQARRESDSDCVCGRADTGQIRGCFHDAVAVIPPPVSGASRSIVSAGHEERTVDESDRH